MKYTDIDNDVKGLSTHITPAQRRDMLSPCASDTKRHARRALGGGCKCESLTGLAVPALDNTLLKEVGLDLGKYSVAARAVMKLKCSRLNQSLRNPKV